MLRNRPAASQPDQQRMVSAGETEMAPWYS